MDAEKHGDRGFGVQGGLKVAEGFNVNPRELWVSGIPRDGRQMQGAWDGVVDEE